MVSTPICSPAERSKFPSLLRYSYLKPNKSVSVGSRYTILNVLENRARSKPRHAALSQRLLNVHVFTLEVDDDDAEIVVLGLMMEILHVRDELLDPASLVLH